MRRRDISKALFATAAGSTVVAQRAEAQTCTQTNAEKAANVMPANCAYPPGAIDRYGTNSQPGITVMLTAINAAIAVANAATLLSNNSGSYPVTALAGTYFHSGPLTMKPNVSLRGASKFATTPRALT